MKSLLESLNSTPITRRTLLRRMGLLTVSAAAGCTPARLVLDRHPAPFDKDSARTDRVLWAFVDTVAPGGPARAASSIEVFGDPYYRFAEYRDFFVSDLCRRAQKRFGTDSFETLSTKQRERVVDEGLHGDAVARRLYEGAVFLAKLSVYGGIANQGNATPAVRFDGANRGFESSQITYENPGRFFPTESTFDGNPT